MAYNVLISFHIFDTVIETRLSANQRVASSKCYFIIGVQTPNTFQDVLPFLIINLFSVHVSKNINKPKKKRSCFVLEKNWIYDTKTQDS